MVDVLNEGKVDAGLAIFHFGEYAGDNVKTHLAEKGVPVRTVVGRHEV